HFGMLDRYLALCEHAGVDITICLNKVDLGVPPEVETATDLYAGLGYRVLLTSATNGTGVEALRERLSRRTSLLTGPSGVGKSSLLNELLPEAKQRIGEISEATGKGRHTTTGVRLLALPGGGWLADSAGIRELALWNVPSEELAAAFVELRPLVGQCEYEDCEHTEGEEGCALWAALAEGRITPDRFASFQRLLAEAREAEAPKW
ncbi:MAG TPA: ribosome small subunit-dependent GTPase A, partial [Ktedonobacterales bacterium]|nr:ribosome small subunit-dependent GTPase A [Ktedonobacterales bacterium]